MVRPDAITSVAEPSLEAVAGELRGRRWHLAFSPEVESRFEADHGTTRVRDLLGAGLVALVVYDLFLLNDLLVRPEVFRDAVLWRLGCMTVYGAAVLALIRRGLAPRWREWLIASTIVVAVFASGMIFLRTTSRAGTYDPFVFSLIFMAGNIAFPLRFVHALVSSVLGVGLAALFVLFHAGMPADARPFALSLLLGTALFTVLACYRIERAARQSYLLVLREELRSQAARRSAEAFALLSQTDALTQLANRRAFDAALQQRWTQAVEKQRPLALMVVDIDNFKRYNDRFGHPAGDECLRRVATTLRACVRDGDFLARHGGEEFVVLLDGGSSVSPMNAAERLRAAIEGQGIAHDGIDGQTVVTISVGLAITSPAPDADPATLVAAADRALYQAKRAGRNGWSLAGDAAATRHGPLDGNQ